LAKLLEGIYGGYTCTQLLPCRVSAVFFPKPMGWGSGEHPGISLYFIPKPTGLEGEDSKKYDHIKEFTAYHILTRRDTLHFLDHLHHL